MFAEVSVRLRHGYSQARGLIKCRVKLHRRMPHLSIVGSRLLYCIASLPLPCTLCRGWCNLRGRDSDVVIILFAGTINIRPLSEEGCVS